MDHETLAKLVATASTSQSEDVRPLARLSARCWPRGADGVMPGAIEWVRRWGPNQLVSATSACACATGRCGACN